MQTNNENQNKKQGNKKQQKGNKKPFVKKEKFNPITYKKVLSGCREEIESNIHDFIIPAFGSLGIDCFDIIKNYNNDRTTLDELAAIMFDLYMQNIPEMIPHGKNSYWSLTYASNRISLKTDKGYQFGWVITYNKERTDYVSVEFFATIYSPLALPSSESVVPGMYWEAPTNK